MIQKLIYKLILIFFPVGAIIIGLNYTVDPANIFSSASYVEGITTILAKGHNVDNISNYDERLLQEQMVKKIPFIPDVVLLGSSRIMQVGGDFFPDKKVLNCGVSHGNIYDIIAIVGLLDSLKKLPNEILLNVDPSLISTTSTDEWRSLQKYYDYFISHYAATDDPSSSISMFTIPKKISSLFSIEYFQSSVKYLLERHSKNYLDVGIKMPVLYGRQADGTVVYSYGYMHGDSLQISENARVTAQRESLGEADPEKQHLLISVLKFLASKNIKINFCMLPYHSAYYKTENLYHSGIINRYESYYRNLAKENGVLLKGNFSPAAYSISDTCFYDMYHSSKFSIKKILIDN